MLLRDTATLRLDLPPPRAVLAGSPPDRGRAWWEPWARIQAGVSRQRESRPARTQGTLRFTLSSHGPENPEEKEIALSLKRWAEQKQNKQNILLPVLHRGKERRSSRRLLRKSKLQHLRVAHVRAASSTFWTTWGLLGRGGALLSCERLDALAYVSIWPGAEQLWRTQEGAHGDGQTEAWPRGQRWMVHHAGAGCAGSPRSAAVPPRTAGRSPRRCRRITPFIWVPEHVGILRNEEVDIMAK